MQRLCRNPYKAEQCVQLDVTKNRNPWKCSKNTHCQLSQKKKKWISDATYTAIREKREAKGKDKKRYQELKVEVQRKLR